MYNSFIFFEKEKINILIRSFSRVIPKYSRNIHRISPVQKSENIQMYDSLLVTKITYSNSTTTVL